MRTMLFAFAAFIAFVSAQCNVEGNTYTTASGESITFGAAVGEWVPALINSGSEVLFSTWTQATATRWGTTTFGSTASVFCTQSAIYNIEFFNDCTQLSFSVISDPCDGRFALLQNAFTLEPRALVGADCVAVGTSLATTLQVSDLVPRLSGEGATVVFGTEQYALLSVGSDAVIVQRWRLVVSEEEGTHALVVDLASFPAGFACDGAEVGDYHLHNLDTSDCTGRVCGSVETCVSRSSLFHQMGLNGYSGSPCGHSVVLPVDGRPASCSDGRQWRRHPQECVAQDVEGGCMYCKGVANGESTQWCLDREHAGCNQVFDSYQRKAFCNLEFECPASIASASLVVFICSLALYFFH